MVVMPREEYGFLVEEDLDGMAAFVSNAISWLSRGSSEIVVATHLDKQVNLT